MLTPVRLNFTIPKPGEKSNTLLLFFLHNFFISIGTILVYVCATVMLLQNNPDFSLPLAYFLAALGSMLTGKIYEYYEHHLPLKKLVRSLMLVSVGLLLVLSMGLYVLPPLVISVALMVGYRALYLLSGLEFWGLSALVFDVRQSKRIFGIIGSGDLPAKAIGALLAVLIHSSYSLYILLWIACIAFLLAYVMQTLTFRFTAIPDHHQRVTPGMRAPQPELINRLFGGSWLVFSLCAGLVFVSASALFIEYSFFFNVKHKYHHQDDVMQYIGYLLCITFGIATLIKLLLSSRVIDRFGLRIVLLVLPVLTLAGSVALYSFSFLTTDEVILLNMFSGLYLAFEIIRKTTFDPVFLVMFQPLFLQQRLKAHTLAKGFYEPLGMAFTGLIGLIAYFNHIHLEAGSFLIIGGFVLLGLLFLVKAYGHYLHELKDALSKRFLNENDLVVEQDTVELLFKNLHSDTPSDVLFSLDWIFTNQPEKLVSQYNRLLSHPSAMVRQQTLRGLLQRQDSYDPAKLFALTQLEPEPVNRTLAAQIACQNPNISEDLVLDFLHAADLATVQGSITGCRAKGRFDAQSQKTLAYLTSSAYPEDILTALNVVQDLADAAYTPFVLKCLQNSDNEIVSKAIDVASRLPSEPFLPDLFSLADHRTHGKSAVFGLLYAGAAGEIYLQKLLSTGQSRLIYFITVACERLASPDSYRLLNQLIHHESLTLRSPALKSLTRLEPSSEVSAGLSTLVQQEFEHIYVLLEGMKSSYSTDFSASISFEINESIRRIFHLFMLKYDAKMVENAMLHVEHASREKRANAIEILDNVIPRNEYLALHALLEEKDPEKKQAILFKTLGKTFQPPSLFTYIIQQGEARFSPWTVALSLRDFPETGRLQALLASYMQHPDALIRDACQVRMNALLPNDNQSINPMHEIERSAAAVSPLEKVMDLKRTELFENTPENVLSALVPIVQEQLCVSGEVLFEKDELGTCMYVIYSGTVDILDGSTRLAQFGKNDIFGELALLDAEARSASAVVTSDALLLKIDQEDFYDLMEERTELLKSVLSILCKRIRRQNTRLREVEKTVATK
ncbi:cyclic nucleotide-binding domain-containing protein [Arundinibacter roseus]|uniref:Cyclic nucleotide-binding domain-containing protein n=1 Tax=Arundinibacter roseus TaxID=2070510 RepID=A0A4V2XAL7_9BACT|nr:cyclic nucleotide-binding domain-containing protein [Arundinibacter roseus]TDB68085.1 cyclic nucleotide-binding domain-containing protein [Arundinibacter roseus]